MKITENKIKKLATLARLNLEESEMKNLFSDFEKILEFINKLEEVNVNNLKPLTHIHSVTNIYREDQVVRKDIKSSVLKNAINHDSDYFKAPKAIKK